MAHNKDLPADFDWVSALGGCSALNMYEQLEADAKKNLDAMEALAKTRGDSPNFSSTSTTGHS